MKRKITPYKERKSHTYFCVGYEGHECGLPITRKKKAHVNEEVRCLSCGQMHRKQYQHEYYQLHAADMKEYQAEYNAKNRKSQRLRDARNHTSASTRKLGSREVTRSLYHPSDLMHSATESFEKAVNRILSGQAKLAGVK